jgi:hypothetical protein
MAANEPDRRGSIFDVACFRYVPYHAWSDGLSAGRTIYAARPNRVYRG